MASDIMHTTDIMQMGKEYKESAWFAQDVPSLKTVEDSTLTLLGHSGPGTFGGHTVDQLWAWLTDREILENKKIKTIELLGCDVNGQPTAIYPGFASRLALKTKATYKIRTLPPRALVGTTVLSPMDDEYFLYIAFTPQATEFSYKLQRSTIESNSKDKTARRVQLALWLKSKGYTFSWIRKGEIRGALEDAKPSEADSKAEPLLLENS
jgi:hypothetical protein